MKTKQGRTAPQHHVGRLNGTDTRRNIKAAAPPAPIKEVKFYEPRLDPASIVIERGIPIPARTGNNAVYPLSTMTPGDTFAIPNGGKKVHGRITASVASYHKRHPDKQRFTVRAVVEAGIPKTRVWCLDPKVMGA